MKKKDCKCKDKVKMSVPEGMEFNKPYNMDHTLHSDHYWDTSRNIDVEVSDGQPYILPFDKDLDRVVKKITDLLKSKNLIFMRELWNSSDSLALSIN